MLRGTFSAYRPTAAGRLVSVHLSSVLVLVLPLSIVLHMVASPALAVDGGIEADVSCRVVKVVDGDTLNCIVRSVSAPQLGLGGELRVRLADINAPELRPRAEPGGREAYEFLLNLVSGRIVVLDVDDKHVFDKYGRVVAILLAPHNETHWVNVNLLMVERGLARVWEHDNQWRLMETPLYVRLDHTATLSDDSNLDLQSLITLAVSGLLILAFVKLAITTLRRRRRMV